MSSRSQFRPGIWKLHSTRRATPDIGDPEQILSRQEVEDPEQILSRQEVEDPIDVALEQVTASKTTTSHQAEEVELRRMVSVRPRRGDEYSGFLIVRLSEELWCEKPGKSATAEPGEEPDGTSLPRPPERDGDRVQGDAAELPPHKRHGVDESCPFFEWLQGAIDLEGDHHELWARKLIEKRPELLCLIAILKHGPPRRLIQRMAAPLILALEEQARGTDLPPLHSLASYWRLDGRFLPERDALAVVRLLNEFPDVDLAYRELRAIDTQVASRDVFADQQQHLDRAPLGIDARWAARQPGGTGADIRFVDLEQGWVLSHDDLPRGLSVVYGDNRNAVGPYRGDHGTAVLGEVIAQVGNGGVIGIAPNASAHVVSHYHAAGNPAGQFDDTNGHVADGVVAAIAELRLKPEILAEIDSGARLELDQGHFQDPSPQILLIEVQRSRKPAEVDEADFDAIRLATASGVLVVEAAGNGGVDLDAFVGASPDLVLERSHPDFRDSGAILVGAAESDLPHNRASFSNFGSRVDCYAWGENVVTCGYGDLFDGGGDLQRTYTRTFSGTSSAAPIVAGAAILLQSLSRGMTGFQLPPAEMRSLLSDPATGTPQGREMPGAIGVMPDLRAIAHQLGLVPDLYVRAGIGQSGGSPPAPHPTAEQPDLVVRPVGPIRPDRYRIKVGLRNQGLAEAEAATATVYGTDAAPFVTPDMWTEIGTTPAVPVPSGDLRVETSRLTWTPPRGLLPRGNFSFLVLPSYEGSPAPPIPPAAPYFDWDLYRAYLRHNRALHFKPVAGPSELPFLLCGTPDCPRFFDFEIFRRLPSVVELELEVPIALASQLRVDPLWGPSRSLANGRREPVIRLRLPPRPQLTLPRLRLAATGDWRGDDDEKRTGRYRCQLIVTDPAGALKSGYSLVLRQLADGEELGRLTWAF